MCYDCWIEYGAPEPDAVALAAVPLVAAVFNENPVAGSLHAILYDWNLEDRFFIGPPLPGVTLSETERACFDAFRHMTVGQRAACLRAYDMSEVD